MNTNLRSPERPSAPIQLGEPPFFGGGSCAPNVVLHVLVNEVNCSPDIRRLEAAIESMLGTEQDHYRAGALCALRCGALFHEYRKALESGPKDARGNSHFWNRASERFGVNRATVSRRMHLAEIWAKKTGDFEASLERLAEGTDLNSLASARAFVGEASTSELYRSFGIIAQRPSVQITRSVAVARNDASELMAELIAMPSGKDSESAMHSLSYEDAREPMNPSDHLRVAISIVKSVLDTHLLGKIETAALDELERVHRDLRMLIENARRLHDERMRLGMDGGGTT